MAHWLGCVYRRPSARGVWCGQSLDMIALVTAWKVFQIKFTKHCRIDTPSMDHSSSTICHVTCWHRLKVIHTLGLLRLSSMFAFIHVNSSLLSVSNSFRYRSPTVMIKILVAFASFLSIPGDMLPPLVTIALRKQSPILWCRVYILKIDISTLCIPSWYFSWHHGEGA